MFTTVSRETLQMLTAARVASRCTPSPSPLLPYFFSICTSPTVVLSFLSRRAVAISFVWLLRRLSRSFKLQSKPCSNRWFARLLLLEFLRPPPSYLLVSNALSNLAPAHLLVNAPRLNCAKIVVFGPVPNGSVTPVQMTMAIATQLTREPVECLMEIRGNEQYAVAW